MHAMWLHKFKKKSVTVILNCGKLASTREGKIGKRERFLDSQNKAGHLHKKAFSCFLFI